MSAASTGENPCFDRDGIDEPLVAKYQSLPRRPVAFEARFNKLSGGRCEGLSRQSYQCSNEKEQRPVKEVEEQPR